MAVPNVTVGVSCYICSEYTQYLYVLKSNESENTAFFPFLKNHRPPLASMPMKPDGSIYACYCCFSFLNGQWESFERNQVPLSKRIYWLKRTDDKPFSGIMVGTQSEYASQVLGFLTDQPNEAYKDSEIEEKSMNEMKTSEKKLNSTELEEALDLSTAGRVNLTYNKTIHPEVNERSTCYLCDDMINKFEHGERDIMEEIKQYMARKYSIRIKDFYDKYKFCPVCLKRLSLLYDFYLFKHIWENHRNYYLNGHRTKKYNIKCIGCNYVISHQDKSHYENNPLLQNINKLNLSCISVGKRSNQLIDNSIVIEQIELCCKCLHLICQRNDDGSHHRMCSMVNDEIVKQGKDRLLYENYIDNYHPNHTSTELLVKCDICCSKEQFAQLKKLNITDQVGMSNLKYVRLLDDTKMFINFILVCGDCCVNINEFSLLSSQPISKHIELYKILLHLRHMLDKALPSPENKYIQLFVNNTIENTSDVSHVNNLLSSSKLQKVDIGSCTITFCFKNKQWKPQLKEFEVEKDESEIVKLPFKELQRPLKIKMDCFICGNLSQLSYTYEVWAKSFEPFVFAIPYKNWKNSGVGLCCTICFHSLIFQKEKFESLNINISDRKYIMSWYFCYVCNGGTFRERLHLLPIKDFPFLLKHTATKKGVVANEGKDVVVCHDCYQTLNSQYLEMERLRVPVEMRQYNWIKRPPPAKGSCSVVSFPEVCKTKDEALATKCHFVAEYQDCVVSTRKKQKL